jgi:hypothetical protein
MGDLLITAAEPAGDPMWTDVLAAVSGTIAALAAVATVVVAVVAARYAKGQLDGLRQQLTVASQQLEEARELRREQAQPYVVMSAVPNRTTPQVVEIVIQNLGTTGARDVVISCTPPLVRTDQHGGAEHVHLPDTIPFLAPGQEWRTFWDHGLERAGDEYDLPDRHDVTIAYTDSSGAAYSTPSVLDWQIFVVREWTVEKTVHHAVGELEKVRKTLQTLARADRVQKVATYDGARLDQQRTEQHVEQRRRHEELLAEIERARTRPEQDTEGQQ